MKIICLAILALFLSGCFAKPEFTLQTKYQKVLVPTKCDVKLPQKPKFDPQNAQSAKNLALYFKQIEAIAKECVK